MNDALSILVIYVSSLLIYCLQTFLYYKTLGLNSRIKKGHLVLIVPVITALTVGALVAANFRIFAALFFVLLYPVLFMGGKLKERILFGIIGCITMLFTNLISISIVSAQMLWSVEQLIQPLVLLVVDAVGVTVYWIMTLVIIHFDSKGKRYLPRKYWTGILVVAGILFLSVTSIFTIGVWFDDAVRERLTLIFTVGLFSLSLVLYFAFYFVSKYFSLANEASLLAAQNAMIEKFLLQKQASEEKIKILSHDLKHSLVEWRTLAIEKNDEEALSSIQEYEAQLADSALVDVGNESANAIINQKALEARQAKITFVVDGYIHDDFVMNKLDFCAFLGNLLDNAIEAAALVEDEAARTVKLTIRRKGDLLMITVENSYAIEPVTQNGGFLSSKQDKALHAIGVISVQRVVEKYHGTVSNSYQDNWFTAAAVLVGYKSVLSDKKETFEQVYP